MKIQIDNVELFEIDVTRMKLWADGLTDPDAEIKRRIAYIIDHKEDRIFENMKKEWVDSNKLTDLGVTDIPTERNALIDLIVARPEYKTKQERDAEADPTVRDAEADPTV